MFIYFTKFSSKFTAHKIWNLFFCIILTYSAWFSLNFFSYHRPYTDSGVFMAVSHHLFCGKMLYQDVWDHKPPLIYLINLFPWWFGDGSTNAILFYERCFGVAGILMLFWVVYRVYRNPVLAWIAALGFLKHFYEPQIFQGGNYTEEYGAVFVLLGLGFILWAKEKSGKPSTWLSGIAGFFYACAVFTKEPFAFSLIAGLVFLVISQDNKWKTVRQRGFGFAIGAAVPTIWIFTYFLWMGNFSAWLDVLSYNYHYSQYSQPAGSLLLRMIRNAHNIYDSLFRLTVAFRITFLLGILSAFYLPFVKKFRYFPWFGIAAFILEFFAVMLGGYKIEHYYLQIIASYIFISTSGIAFLLELLHRWRNSVWVILTLFLLMVLLGDRDSFSSYYRRLNTPCGKINIGPISQMIREKHHAGDTLWADFGVNSKYYAETQLLSPTKYLYVYEHLFLDSCGSTRQEKIDTLIHDLKLRPPTFIILSQSDIETLRKIGLSELADWIIANYQKNTDVREEDKFVYEYRRSQS